MRGCWRATSAATSPAIPTVVVQNMPGAGSLTAVHYLDTTAPKDGTVIDIFNFGTIGDSQALARTRSRSISASTTGSAASARTSRSATSGTRSGVKTLDELKARPVVHMGLTGVGTSSDINQRILKNIFGVKLQQIAGYPGSAEQRIAIERGELDGDCGAWSSISETGSSSTRSCR